MLHLSLPLRCRQHLANGRAWDSERLLRHNVGSRPDQAALWGSLLYGSMYCRSHVARFQNLPMLKNCPRVGSSTSGADASDNSCARATGMAPLTVLQRCSGQELRLYASISRPRHISRQEAANAVQSSGASSFPPPIRTLHLVNCYLGPCFGWGCRHFFCCRDSDHSMPEAGVTGSCLRAEAFCFSTSTAGRRAPEKATLHPGDRLGPGFWTQERFLDIESET